MDADGYSFKAEPICNAPFLKCYVCGHTTLSKDNLDKRLFCLKGYVPNTVIAVAVLRMFQKDVARYVAGSASGQPVAVLIGACAAHLSYLEKLRSLTIKRGSIITQNMIEYSRV